MTSSSKFHSGFQITIAGLAVPITILNIFGGIVSGVWLAVLGEWSEIFRGILFGIISSFLIGFAVLPGLLFAGPGIYAFNKGKKVVGLFFAFLSNLYTVIVMTFWCTWILWLFTASATFTTFIPLLIWSYGIALGPWMWLAKKDQEGGGNEYSAMTTFFAQTAYLIVIILYALGASFGTVFWVFAIIMFASASVQTWFLSQIMEYEKAVGIEP